MADISAQTRLERQTIRDRISSLFGLEPRILQVDVIHHLLYRKTDLIFIGKTGFGKSILFQSLPLLYDTPAIAIILMPLKALQNQQCRKLSTISRARPFVLNGDTNNPTNLEDIREGAYTHIFTSPEIVTSKDFHLAVLTYPEFQSSIKLVAIDEVHLVDEWRDFRPQYNTLGVLRSRLPGDVPFLGVSATLDPASLNRIQHALRYAGDCEVIRTSVDRPEIYIQVECLRKPQSGLLDLQHLLPGTVTHYSQVPKTVIYMNTIVEICQCVSLFRKWMCQLDYPPDSDGWVSPYFADMAEEDKARVNDLFERAAEELDEPRILIASDAFGLGIDNKDIARVVIYGLPSTIQSLVQRMGRAMRGGAGQGRFLFLHPPWCLGHKAGSTLQPLKQVEQNDVDGDDPLPISDGNMNGESADEADEVAVDNNTARPGRKTDAERRRDMDAGLYDIINGPVRAGDCIRLRLLRIFADETYCNSEAARPNPCCSECHEEFRSSTDPHEALQPPSVNGSSVHIPWYRAKLQSWREQKAAEVCGDCRLGVEPTIVMSDEYLDATIRYGTHIKDLSDLRRWAGSWPDMHRYGADVLAILQEGRTQSLYSSELVEMWKATKGKKGPRRKKDRTQVEVVLSSEDSQAQRKEAWLIKKGVKPQNQVNEGKGRRGSPRPMKDKGKGSKKRELENSNASGQAGSSKDAIDIGPDQQQHNVPSIEAQKEDANQLKSSQRINAQPSRQKGPKQNQQRGSVRQPMATMDANQAVSGRDSEKSVDVSMRGRMRFKKIRT